MRKISLMLLFFICFITINAQTEITEKEITELAKKVDALAKKNKWKEIDDKYFNYESFGEIVAKEMELTGDAKAEFSKGLKSSIGAGGILSRMGGDIEHFEFLRIHKLNGKHHFLCRILAKTGGVNYYDFSVVKNKELKIDDLYVYLNNQYISKSVSQILITMMPGIEDGDGKSKASLITLKKIIAAKNKGDFSRMLTLYNNLSEEQKKIKGFLNIRIVAAQQTDVVEYKKALDDYYSLYPNEPGVNLMMIDRYVLDEEYQKALDVINRVDSIVGGDVYLNILRANMCTFTEDYETAISSYEKYFVKFPNDPDNTEAYPTYISLLLFYDRYDDAIATAKKFKKQFGLDAFDSIPKENFPDFYESEDYKNYKSSK
jgi:tetratricopeptide (TPR) repeat protein